ncbi:MAG: hypothetical protein BGO51_24900 [Rhodospirillales bacterium 69-11]|nr:MAG: hypothetical protein BGO51_24900 [Rhodospirillales bacterium 69-11]
MRLKLFRAANMADAMARVRAELGNDALILGSRPVQEGVEITAALEPAATAPLPAEEPGRAELLAFHGVPPMLHGALVRRPLDEALGRALPFGELTLSGESRPLLLAGMPGAGKTLTVARLATRLVLAGVAPMVITADGKRAGATEQLAAFTRLLGLTLIVASHPVTLGRALARRATGTPVLIDCPGSDAFDRGQMEELRALAAAADGTIALVLPAGLQVEEAADLARAYAAQGAQWLVGTRLDLARRFGGLLAAAAAAPLTLVEAGIGPGAADGLVPLTPRELARRMEERLMPAPAAAARRPTRADPPAAPPSGSSMLGGMGPSPAAAARPVPWASTLRSGSADRLAPTGSPPSGQPNRPAPAERPTQASTLRPAAARMSQDIRHAE